MANEVKTYKAVFWPDDDGWWFIDVPELPGCHSQGRNIANGRDHIRETISMVTNADLDTLDLDIDYRLPRAQQAAVARARRSRQRAAEAAGVGGTVRIVPEAAGAPGNAAGGHGSDPVAVPPAPVVYHLVTSHNLG